MKFSKTLLSVSLAVGIAGLAVAEDKTAEAEKAPQKVTRTLDVDWAKDAQAELQKRLAEKPNLKKAKNVILMVGDGNGVNSTYITRLYMGQKAGGYGDEYLLPQEKFPYLAHSKTYNTNGQTPDSAGTATQMNTGVKTKSGLIGLSDKARRGHCEDVAEATIPSFAEQMAKEGKQVGVVTTARLTHATPAAVYAHSADCNWESSVGNEPKEGEKAPAQECKQKDIAQQLVDTLETGTIDIALGGGLKHFTPKAEGTKGKRKDGQDLTKVAQEKGISFVNDLATLQAANLDGKTPVLGIFGNSHASYEADRSDKDPSLAQMAESAINYLSKSENGYYLMIEGGRIDHANHAGNAYRTVTDGEEFAKTVQKVTEMVGDDTLVIVTADHAHALTVQGYAGRGAPILGLAHDVNPEGIEYLPEPSLADDGKPYTLVSYANGPGSVLKKDAHYAGTRGVLTQEEVMDPDYVQESLIPRSSETHSGVDVGIYAKGPWAHLFTGTLEQNYIYHVMDYAVHNGE